MRKILVTGAGGLLGTYLVPFLSSQGDDVIAAGRGMIDLSRPIDPSKLPERVDAVIYLAQSSRFREFPQTADDIFQVNTAQVLTLLDYARRASATNFVYASTGGVYASTDEPVAEDAPLASPMGFYPASKRASEVLMEAYQVYFNIAVLRYFFIYGAGQKREMLMPRLVDSVREGRCVTLQGEDGLRINPVHARDAASATAAASRLSSSAIVNVAGPEIRSIRQMCNSIGVLVGREPAFRVDPERKASALIAQTGLMAKLLVPPIVGFEEGVRDLLMCRI